VLMFFRDAVSKNSFDIFYFHCLALMVVF